MTDAPAKWLSPWLFLVFTGLVIWLGFVLHTSGGDDLLLDRYSPAYAGFVGLGGVVWLFSAWWGWRHRATLGATLRAVFTTTFITLVLAAILLPLAYIYLHQRSLDQHVLHPLQSTAHAFFQYEEPIVLPASQPDTLRVLALGGSTTYGVALERHETYPARLQALLEERFPGRTVTVLNAGVPWHTSMHSLLRYVAKLSAWQPQVIIIMHAFNDIFQSSEGRLTSGHFQADYGHFFGALGKRVNPEDKFASQLGMALTDNWLARTWYSDVRRPTPDTPADERIVDLLKPLPTFERNLAEIARRAGNDGVQVILMTQPSIYRPDMPAGEHKTLFYDFYYNDYAQVPDIDTQADAMARFNSATRRIAAATGATLVDLDQELPKSIELMYDDVHYTATGAQRVARIVAEAPLWNRLLTAPPAAQDSGAGQP